MPVYTPVEVDPHDRDALEKIGRLRIAAWEGLLPGLAQLDCWLDEHDSTARHWVIFDDGELVAAARLSVHSTLLEVPDAAMYTGVLPPGIPKPIASINRLVTHPAFRRRGCSQALDEVRFAAAAHMDCGCIVVATEAGSPRLAQLVTSGFGLAGEPAPGPVGHVYANLTIQILIRYLRRHAKKQL